MLRDCKAILLPSEGELEPNGIYRSIRGFLGLWLNIETMPENSYENECSPMHLHITSDDEIKEGDWCLLFDSLGNLFSKHAQQYKPSEGHVLNDGLKKIIASTDSELKIKTFNPPTFDYPYRLENLPLIPESFIKSYVKNPVDKVMVEYDGSYRFSERLSELKIEHVAIGFDFKGIKLEDGCIVISLMPVEQKMYTRDEVESIIKSTINKFQGGELIDYVTESQKSNWINENLK